MSPSEVFLHSGILIAFLNRGDRHHAQAVTLFGGPRVHPRHHENVGSTLDRFRGAKLTYVDASSLAFMAARDITRAWSTDRHLGLSGAEVLPRS